MAGNGVVGPCSDRVRGRWAGRRETLNLTHEGIEFGGDGAGLGHGLA